MNDRNQSTDANQGQPRRDANGKLIDPATGQPFSDQSQAESDLRRAEEITDAETTPAEPNDQSPGSDR